MILFGMSLAALAAFRNNDDKKRTENNLPPSNPFSSRSALPYHTAPFDKIKDADYKPAFEEGIKEQLNEIKQIADNTQRLLLKIQL